MFVLQLGFLMALTLPTWSMNCYDTCIQKFTLEMDKVGRATNNSALLTSSFCRAMSNQVRCLNTVVTTCPIHQRTLIQNMLTIFIQPDYQRTCGAGTNNVSTSSSSGTTTALQPTTGVIGGMAVQDHTLIMCTQKVQSCQNSFNSSFMQNMAKYNISGLCQSLKQFTLCFVNLLSSDCGHLVNRHIVYSMQKEYGGICSNDAQANTHTMIECTNRTMQCYVTFNSSFTPAVSDYNLVQMCRAIHDYTTCMHNVSHTNECAQFTSSSLAGIQSLKRKHNAYCGDDHGQTAIQCVEKLQDCFVPFNMTFFPAIHAANLTLTCKALSGYTKCVARLTPTCSGQLGQIIQSAQAINLQYRDRCHPNTLKLATCSGVKQCIGVFTQSLTIHRSDDGICGSIGDYFPCVSRSLDECKLPQSTTEVEFGALGTLMSSYCDKVSTNKELARCPAFVKCSTAIMVSFTPNLKNMYEGSTWCTFMQLSIGCAEHALQSAGCFLESNVQLQSYITELDQLRMQTCEQVDPEVDLGFGFKHTQNMQYEQRKTKDGGKDAAPALSHNMVILLTALFMTGVAHSVLAPMAA